MVLAVLILESLIRNVKSNPFDRLIVYSQVSVNSFLSYNKSKKITPKTVNSFQGAKLKDRLTAHKGIFPDRIAAPIQYGPVVKATTVYFSVYQYVPYKRIVFMFKDCHGLHLSEGCVDNFLQEMSDKALPAYENIREQIHTAPVVSEPVELRLGVTKPVAR